MSGGEWLAATGVLLAVLLGGLLFALASVAATLRDLRATVNALQDESLAMVREMRDALRDAENEIDRVGAMLTAAESVGDHIDTASRIVSKTVTNPVVKVLALGTGTKRAVRRMRAEERRSERARSAETGATRNEERRSERARSAETGATRNEERRSERARSADAGATRKGAGR